MKANFHRLLRRSVHCIAGFVSIGALIFFGAEIGSRLDDWLFMSISPLSNPTYDSELRFVDEGFVRGRPNGSFKRWQLNEYGFNGPSNPLLPHPDCQRLVILGASETFGSYESPEYEFVSQLRRRLEDGLGHCFEVVNASIVGMSPRSAIAYWNGWVSQFRPQFVFLYPNPMLSLRISNDSDSHCVTTETTPRPATSATSGGIRYRFVDRLRDALDKPQWLVDIQIERQITHLVRKYGADWILEEVPEQCFGTFQNEIEDLINAVVSDGSIPILATHAFRSDGYERGTNLWLRQWIPRVTGAGQLRYHLAANGTLRSLAERQSVVVFDAERILQGCRECFVDPVHFSDAGATRLASAFVEFFSNYLGHGKNALQ